MLWKLSRLKSSFVRYFPAFLTGKKVCVTCSVMTWRGQSEMEEFEGALEMHVGEDGLVHKLVNRPVTEEDRRAAEQLAGLKKKSEEAEQRREREITDAAVEQLREKSQSS